MGTGMEYRARGFAGEGVCCLSRVAVSTHHPIQRLLIHTGEPATPPRIAPARAPPDWFEADFDQTILDESEKVEPVPEFESDRTVSW